MNVQGWVWVTWDGREVLLSASSIERLRELRASVQAEIRRVEAELVASDTTPGADAEWVSRRIRFLVHCRWVLRQISSQLGRPWRMPPVGHPALTTYLERMVERIIETKDGELQYELLSRKDITFTHIRLLMEGGATSKVRNQAKAMLRSKGRL